MAPIIPGLNSHEIFSLFEAVKKAGARDVNYTFVRLNGPVADVFSNCVKTTFPDRAEKVLNHILEAHNGILGSSNSDLEWAAQARYQSK